MSLPRESCRSSAGDTPSLPLQIRLGRLLAAPCGVFATHERHERISRTGHATSRRPSRRPVVCCRFCRQGSGLGSATCPAGRARAALMRDSLTGFNWDSSRPDCFASRCVQSSRCSHQYRTAAKRRTKPEGGSRVGFGRIMVRAEVCCEAGSGRAGRGGAGMGDVFVHVLGWNSPVLSSSIADFPAVWRIAVSSQPGLSLVDGLLTC